MNRFHLTGLLLAALAAPAVAVTPAPAKPATTVKPVRKPAPKAAPKPPPEPVLEEPSSDQFAAANVAYLGGYDCELNQELSIVPHVKVPGYLDVLWQKQVYVMKPVMSSTGALRLEDVRGRTLLIQIANKSMLMDVLAGRRLVDECVHEAQRVARAAPPPEGTLGIDPVKVAAAAAAQAASAASTTPAAAAPASAASGPP